MSTARQPAQSLSEHDALVVEAAIRATVNRLTHVQPIAAISQQQGSCELSWTREC
jgi:hypothetical protein